MNKEYAEQIRNVVNEMSEAAGFDSTFADSFFNRIKADESLLNEFVVYLTTNKFTCENKVAGYSVVDILVWQMDHFKAFLDRDSLAKSNNECEKLLLAFDTFMKMKEDPEKYLELLTGESGSDYDGKTFN